MAISRETSVHQSSTYLKLADLRQLVEETKDFSEDSTIGAGMREGEVESVDLIRVVEGAFE